MKLVLITSNLLAPVLASMRGDELVVDRNCVEGLVVLDFTGANRFQMVSTWHLFTVEINWPWR